MSAAANPQSFAETMQGLLGATPFWVAPTQYQAQVNQFADPENPAPAVSDRPGGFTGAAKAALEALDPFNGLKSTSAIVAQATVPVSKSAAAALDAGADSLKAAGGGISSGFKWATAIVLLGLAAYVFFLAAPFLPKPSGGSR